MKSALLVATLLILTSACGHAESETSGSVELVDQEVGGAPAAGASAEEEASSISQAVKPPNCSKFISYEPPQCVGAAELYLAAEERCGDDRASYQSLSKCSGGGYGQITFRCCRVGFEP